MEFDRFLKEDFSPEKQEAICKILEGSLLIVLNIDKVTKEERMQVADKIHSLFHPI